jgi:hypothetical protein
MAKNPTLDLNRIAAVRKQGQRRDKSGAWTVHRLTGEYVPTKTSGSFHGVRREK